MASNPWVVNASPVVLLGKTGHLDLLAALADTVVVPQAVASEVGAKPDGASGRSASSAGPSPWGGLDAQVAPVIELEHLRKTWLYVSDALVQHNLARGWGVTVSAEAQVKTVHCRVTFSSGLLPLQVPASRSTTSLAAIRVSPCCRKN